MKGRGGFIHNSREIPYPMPKFVSGVGYTCSCGVRVRQAIEGEIICARCWSENQMDDDARACDTAIKEYKQEQREESKCPGCGRKSEYIGYHDGVQDVHMECPMCGTWWLWSKEAGNEPLRRAGLM